MLEKTFSDILHLWKDDRGAVNTVEIIGYSVLVAGAAALVGYGFTALGRGKTGKMVETVHSMKSINDPVTESSTYTYTIPATGGTNSDTGVPVDATGN